MATSSNASSPLGKLSQLPKELRILIWKELLPESRASGSFHPPTSSLSILRTSRQLSDEVSTELYNGRVLTFRIAPNPIPQSRISMIQIFDHLGSEWSLFAQFHTVMAEQVYMVPRWRCLPFHRLKCVRFEIEAPNPHDPGQLIQMWNKLCWLLDLLPDMEKLPDVEVCAIESSDRKWCKNGRLLLTSKDKVPSGLTHWQWITNLEILLTPFLRLRMAKTIAVIHPFEGCKELLDTLISNILRKATSTIPFGLDHNCDDEDSDDEYENIDDEVIMSMEDTWTVWFDYILDDLPGPSARFARLERFSTWNPHYEKNMWCLINGWETSIGGCLVSDSERHLMVEALTERVLAKLAFNPMSLRHLKEDEQPNLWYTADDWSRPENDVLDSGKDGWWPAKWWEYQQGIPRISSLDYQNHLDRYGYQWILPDSGGSASESWSSKVWYLQGTSRSLRDEGL
jgi:hypothetical protein